MTDFRQIVHLKEVKKVPPRGPLVLFFGTGLWRELGAGRALSARRSYRVNRTATWTGSSRVGAPSAMAAARETEPPLPAEDDRGVAEGRVLQTKLQRGDALVRRAGLT